jgi:hypothetical protein
MASSLTGTTSNHGSAVPKAKAIAIVVSL